MKREAPVHPGYVVLEEVEPGHWVVMGEVDRQPGLSARAGRVSAVKLASGGRESQGGEFAAILRSEWRMARDT